MIVLTHLIFFISQNTEEIVKQIEGVLNFIVFLFYFNLIILIFKKIRKDIVCYI